MLQKFTRELKEEIEQAIDNLGQKVEKIDDLTPEIKKAFSHEYDEFIQSVGSGVREFLEKENKNRYFWLELIERRGKGRGYNDDVAKMFHNKLMTFRHGLDINGVFQDYSEKKWESLIDSILRFLKKYKELE